MQHSPPEYLVLVDRAGFRDHQARLYSELAAALEREGVYVERYFFDGDPRVCCGESGVACFSLAELYSRFAGHRLLVFGNGDMFLDAVTGEPASWTSFFAEWRDRALLTPRDTAQWGLREVSLAGTLVVLPASLEGLLALVAHFESLPGGDVHSWREGGNGRTPPETLRDDAPNLLPRLREHLGPRAFEWLSVCALYPELHWDLTLYLGARPELGGDLIREENLLRLIRLPWFRHGSMPDEVRWLLINEMGEEKTRAVSAVIVELLEKDPPPAETYAADAHQMNLVVQRFIAARGRHRREAAETLAAFSNRFVRDYTAVRFLESARSSTLGLVLPSRLRRLFYRNGIPAFGLNTGARLLCLAAVTFGASPCINFTPRQPSGTTLQPSQAEVTR